MVLKGMLSVSLVVSMWVAQESSEGDQHLLGAMERKPSTPSVSSVAPITSQPAPARLEWSLSRPADPAVSEWLKRSEQNRIRAWESLHQNGRRSK